MTVLFFVSYIVTSLDEKKKNAKKFVKTTYKRIKIFIDAFSLAIALYSIYIAAERATVISILLTVASLIGWIAKVSCSIITKFLEARVDLIYAAFQVDFEPIYKMLNVYKKIVGDELKDEVSPEMRAELDAIHTEYVQEKEEKKQKLRETRREVRKERFASWRSEISEKFAAKKNKGDSEDGD